MSFFMLFMWRVANTGGNGRRDGVTSGRGAASAGRHARDACRHRPRGPQPVRVKTGRVCPQGLDQHRSDPLRPSAQPSPSDPENKQGGESAPVCWWIKSQPRKPSPGLQASRAQRGTLCLSHRAREERAEGEARAR